MPLAKRRATQLSSLSVFGQDLVAGLGEPGAVLLQAGQHDLVAIIDMSPAEARNVARAGIVTGLLRRHALDHQDKGNDEKNAGHSLPPYADRSVAF
jgi:hypothetical protein